MERLSIIIRVGVTPRVSKMQRRFHEKDRLNLKSLSNFTMQLRSLLACGVALTRRDGTTAPDSHGCPEMTLTSGHGNPVDDVVFIVITDLLVRTALKLSCGFISAKPTIVTRAVCATVMLSSESAIRQVITQTDSYNGQLVIPLDIQI